MKRREIPESRPRPVLALAVYADGRRVPLMGWVIEAGETLFNAIQRAAIDSGAEYAEIVATLH